MSTYAERQAYRDSHPGAIVDNNSSSDGGFTSSTPNGVPSGGGGGGGGSAPAPSGGGGGGGGSPAPSGSATVYQTVNGPKTEAQMQQELQNAGWGGGEPIPQAYARTAGGTVTPTSGPGATGGGGATTYQTVNGPKTEAQMQQELQNAGWAGGEPVPQAYARTSGGPVTASTDAGAVPPPIANVPMADKAGAQQAITNAQAAAYQVYLNAKLQLDTDDLAFRKATQAFVNAISAAGLTGTYEGQQTLAAKAQEFSQGVTAAGLTGQYNGSPTLQAQQQAFSQALQSEQLRQQTANQYLTLTSNLRGPADYGQYLKTLASTPQGIGDLVRGAAGAYVPGTGTTGTPTQPITLPGFINQVGGVPGTQPGTQPGGAQATYDQYMQQAAGLPSPNQIAPAAWNTYTDTQKQVLLGMYEQRGWNPQDVQQLYTQSLPKYTLNTPSTGSMRLV